MRGFLTFFLVVSLACSVGLAAEAVPDNRISADLTARLRRSKLAADSVRFSVKDGVVTWEGQVAIPQRKGAATRMAKAAGARKVENRIQIGAAAVSKQEPKKFVVKFRQRAH